MSSAFCLKLVSFLRRHAWPPIERCEFLVAAGVGVDETAGSSFVTGRVAGILAARSRGDRSGQQITIGPLPLLVLGVLDVRGRAGCCLGAELFCAAEIQAHS
jgi:hypothetical protein